MADINHEIPRLWREFSQKHDPQLRERLILHYAPLVTRSVHDLGDKHDSTVERADLVSYGIFGLIEAVDSFEPGADRSFEPFALERVHGAIMDGLRLHELFAQVALMNIAALDDLLNSANSSPSVEETRTYSGSSTTEAVEVQAALAGALAKLDESERAVILRYYYEHRTVADISRELEISESQVGQLHAQAMLQLRTWLPPTLLSTLSDQHCRHRGWGSSRTRPSSSSANGSRYTASRPSPRRRPQCKHDCGAQLRWPRLNRPMTWPFATRLPLLTTGMTGS